jgi:hypothetical protein
MRSALAIRKGSATPAHFCDFTALRGGDAELGTQFGDRAGVRCGYLGERQGGGRTWRRRREGGGHLEIGRVIISVGEHDGVLAGFGQNVKFLRRAAADAAAVRLHGPKIQSDTRENPRIRFEHQPIAFREACFIRVERIGVLHQELARSHDAETRADFIAELGLNLVEIHRQLFVASEFTPGNVGDHFLVRGPVGEFPVVPILEAQQLRAILVPAGRFLPQFRGLDRRHG